MELNNCLEKAMKNLVIKHEPTGKFACNICSKLYTHEKVARKHVDSEHPLQLTKEIVIIQQGEKVRYKEYCLGQIDKFFFDADAKQAEMMDKFLRGFEKRGVESTLVWDAEPMLLWATTYRLISQLKYIKDKRKEENPTGWIIDFALDLKSMRADIISNLIRSPYRHSSTSAMSNFNTECEKRAKAEFLEPFGTSNTLTWLERVVHVYGYLED